MRLCRFEQQGQTQVGFYSEEFVIPISAAAGLTGIADPDSNC